MPKLTNRAPAYRLFKPRNLACVTIDGKRVYLGPYDSKESHEAYARLIAEWEARGRRPHVPSPRELRRAKAAVEAAGEPVPLAIVELVDRFLAHAEGYYRKGGKPTNELAMFKSALRPVVALYGRLPAREFRPQHLKAVRDELVRKGWNRTTTTGRVLSGQYSRKVINGYMRRIRQVFGWAVEEVPRFPASVHERLRRVKPLLQGRTTAVELAPVRAVDDATIEKTMPWLTPVIRALVQFQRLTG